MRSWIELWNSILNSVGITLASFCKSEHGINSLHGPLEPDFGTIMAELPKKQRKIPGGHRAHVKKLLAQVDDSITNFEPSLQNKLLQQKIREKLDTLKSLDGKILELVDDENEDESIEHEVVEVSEITDKKQAKSRGLWFASIRL